jgi:YkoY family integral membrane protein
MDFINGVLSNFAEFFSVDSLVGAVTDSSNWMIILSLVVIEGLLSADNALVLAMMVKVLPEKQQKKALTYGIWGAYMFRFLAIGVGTYLIKIWWIKLLAAGYLIYMSIGFFTRKKEQEKAIVKTGAKGFWGTILAVELMDVAFSIDSVTVAVGISDQMWVLFLGAIFGILMMRGVAKGFVALIDKIPELESGAYILIAIIAVKMILELFHIEFSDYTFFGALVVVFLVAFAVNKMK